MRLENHEITYLRAGRRVASPVAVAPVEQRAPGIAVDTTMEAQDAGHEDQSVHESRHTYPVSVH